MISRIIRVEVGVISLSLSLWLIVTLTETLIILEITKANLIKLMFYCILNEKTNGSNVFATSLTASNTKRANLT